ncbi:uncharacterized protein LOC125856558 [Solanum stenotomum]|uniref:uncharacterized protein LOC125856558 n=1 Tax=Solanum stenotomum TaxID=172797 RepID=UPI0020D062DC|nr:uncharacterized protein LOC125856558 [Solanum stenotomum]
MTDQRALKYLLDQKLHIGFKKKWVGKLMRCDFEVEYKKGRENKAVDDVSRSPMTKQFLLAIIPSHTEEYKVYSYIHQQIKKHGKLMVFKLHGMPENVLITLRAQYDGQTEVVNKTLETYLRCYCADSQKDWNMYLSLAEWWYNTTFHSAIQTSPYEALYEQQPPTHLPYLPGEAMDDKVDISLIPREFKTQLLRFHLDKAQQRMTDMANKY